MNKIPITMGIVGHLDAIITPSHEKAIIDVLENIHKKWPNSPVTLFSQLAKGADTKVAEIFLEQKEKTERNYNLIVPVPFEIEVYKKDFNKEGLAKFNELLSKAQRTFVLDNSEIHTKNGSYQNGGKFVADSSIILLAIWDGKDNGKPGGTSDIVKYKKGESFYGEIDNNIFNIKGSLIELSCNRESTKDKKEIVLRNDYMNILLEDFSIKKTLDKIDKLNAFVDNNEITDFQTSAVNLYPLEKNKDSGIGLLRNYYSVIDCHALQQQKKYHWLIKGLYILGFILLTAFEIYKIMGFSEFFIVAVPGLIFMAFLIFKFGSRWRYHMQYIEDRVLAESLRVQFYWKLSNITNSVADYILRIHKIEYNWANHILNAIHGLTFMETKQNGKISDIKKHWIDNQQAYFSKKLNDLKIKEQRFSIAFKFLFVAALTGFCVIGYLSTKSIENIWSDYLLILVTLSFGVFALLRGYYEKKGYEQINNQFKLMENIFSTTRTSIDKINSNTLPDSEKEKLISELYYLAGKEALVENGNWYMIFKDKDPELEGLSG